MSLEKQFKELDKNAHEKPWPECKLRMDINNQIGCIHAMVGETCKVDASEAFETSLKSYTGIDKFRCCSTIFCIAKAT